MNAEEEEFMEEVVSLAFICVISKVSFNASKETKRYDRTKGSCF